MSALPDSGPAGNRAVPGSIAAAQWAQIRAAAPQAAATQRYLQLLAAFLAPGSVDAADNALRQEIAYAAAHGVTLNSGTKSRKLIICKPLRVGTDVEGPGR